MRPQGYVGVVGPADASPELVGQAVEVGRLLARQGLVVVTGGLGGVMGAAARGAAEGGGTSLGLLPGPDRSAADPHLTLTVPTGLGEMRNALLVRTCHALVAVGSSWGTLSEIALAARTGVPVVLLDGPRLLDEVPAGEGGVRPPVRAASPADAVAEVVRCLGLPGMQHPAGGADRPGAAAPEGGDAHVLGVDRQQGTWVGALLPASGTGALRLVSGADLGAVVARASARGTVSLVAVDIPIGLPDTGTRQADVLARRRLGPRGSTVFDTPVRDALAATTYAEARAVSVARTGGRSLSAQSYALRAAILDVDGYVRAGAGPQVVEVHPELSFAELAGAPLPTRKKTPEGARERADLLTAAGIELPADLDLDRRGVDDVLDAAVAAWSGARVLAGVAQRVPEVPERFSDGIDAAMRV